MDVKVKKLPKSEMEIKITVSEEDMKKHYNKACEELSKDVKVKGFRPGHVPQDILETHLDKKYIIAYSQELAIKSAYAQHVVKENLPVVARPNIKIETDSPFTFVAIVAVMPEIEIKDYEKIKIPKEEVKVKESDIEDVIRDLKKYMTTYKDVDREIKIGDRVEVDFEGFDDKGEPVANTKSSNHPIVIGDGMLVPGFEDNLIGLKKGGKKEFDLTFPKDYGKKDFQNRKLKFKAEIKNVQESAIPELNEESIEKITGKKQTVEEFKKTVEKNIHERKIVESKQKRESEYLEELLKRVKIELPNALMDEEVEYLLEDIKDELSMKNIEFERYLKQTKTTEDELRKKYRPEAEKRLKIRLSLQHLLKLEKIEPSEAEITEEFEKVKANYPAKEHAKIESDFNKGPLKNQIVNKISLNKFFDKVLA